MNPTTIKAAIIGLFLALLCTGSFYEGHHIEHQARVAEVTTLNAQHKDALQQIDTANRAALQAATDHARAIETQAASDMAALDAKHTKELNDAKNSAATDLAALRAGGIRVRDEFTCAGATGAGGGGAQAAAGTGVGHAAPAGGLQAADAEFLLRVGAEADEVAVQLKACQAIVTQDRAGASGVPQP